MNLEVNPEEFVSSIAKVRETKSKSNENVAIRWADKIMKKIQSRKGQLFFLLIKELGYCPVLCHKIYSGFPKEYEITSRIVKILYEQYKLNLQIESEFKYYILKISLCNL